MVPVQGEPVILNHYNRLSSGPSQCFMIERFSLIFKINPSGWDISPFYVFTQDKTWGKV